jgi:hypothetical protein
LKSQKPRKSIIPSENQKNSSSKDASYQRKIVFLTNKPEESNTNKSSDEISELNLKKRLSRVSIMSDFSSRRHHSIRRNTLNLTSPMYYDELVKIPNPTALEDKRYENLIKLFDPNYVVDEPKDITKIIGSNKALRSDEPIKQHKQIKIQKYKFRNENMFSL